MTEKLNLNHPKIKAFVNHIKTECRGSGIRVELRKVKYLNLGHGIKCSGYFDEEKKRLVVAANHPLALGVLVHEFGHYTQWKEKIPLWTKAAYAMGYVEDWLSGEPVKNIKKWIGLSRDLELDNEKRSVQIMKEFGLPMDPELYTKRANAYVLFYNWLLVSRRWSKPGNSPYGNASLLDACSTKFNMRYDRLSNKLQQIFEESGI